MSGSAAFAQAALTSALRVTVKHAKLDRESIGEHQEDEGSVGEADGEVGLENGGEKQTSAEKRLCLRYGVQALIFGARLVRTLLFPEPLDAASSAALARQGLCMGALQGHRCKRRLQAAGPKQPKAFGVTTVEACAP